MKRSNGIAQTGNESHARSNPRVALPTGFCLVTFPVTLQLYGRL